MIPEDHLACWYLLVDSCRLLCQLVLTKEQVKKAHELLVKFCKSFETLYGSKHCTPNMHMACHLQECILDWCFPFERYNGLLEGLQKSWNGPEKQMFQKFLNMQYIDSLQHTREYKLMLFAKEMINSCW